MTTKPKIGILALQGAFAKHQELLNSMDIETILVRKPSELINCDALIIPGGESGVMFRQMNNIGLIEPLQKFAKEKPLFGTCAGLILMSSEILGDQNIQPLGLLDVTVERNAFGRQIESFQTEIEVTLPGSGVFQSPATFIRAPKIKRIGSEVQVLASCDGEPILIQQGIHLAASFHPELTSDRRIHQYFLKILKT